MIIRAFNNKIMVINRSSYHSDEEYYSDLVYYLFNVKFSKENNTIDKIKDLLKKKSVINVS